MIIKLKIHVPIPNHSNDNFYLKTHPQLAHFVAKKLQLFPVLLAVVQMFIEFGGKNVGIPFLVLSIFFKILNMAGELE